jgi:predicted DsbA family dithiol-disulfide isomerase
LKKEFLIEDEWAPYQLRPHTPPEGIPYADLFPGADMTERYANLNKAGAPFGIIFGERTFLSNSRQALEAGEYARDQGRFHSFHERVFRAYFTELLDIGDRQVLLEIARETGLDQQELNSRLRDAFYSKRLAEAVQDAGAVGVTAVPTFIINGSAKIVGALPLESFRERLRRIGDETK